MRKKNNILTKLLPRKPQDQYDQHTALLRVGDYTTCGIMIVFKVHFLNKSKERAYLMGGINKKAKYVIIRDDSSDGIYYYDKEFKDIKKVILTIFKMIKKECKLKHKPIKVKHGTIKQ